MQSRRQFIKTSALVSLSPALPTFLSKAATASIGANKNNGRILVVVQLDGGNDGINTIVPFKDERYVKHRKHLRIPKEELIKVADELAFHPSLRSVSDLFEDHRLSVVHGVGYPNPNRSHFESMAIWHAATTNENVRHGGNGWIGESLSMRPSTSGPHAIHVGDETLPVALRGRRCSATTIADAADLQLRLKLADTSGVHVKSNPSTSLTDFLTKSVSDAYLSAKELGSSTHGSKALRYPNSELARRLQLVSQLIKSDAAARVYYTTQGGYDTHADQLITHANLLGELSSSLKAFMDDLRESRLDDRILVIAFSEFGRRVKENASFGTDHGTAGPVFLAGTHLAQRSYGDLPKLTELDDGDLRHGIDFRQIYSAVLTDWLEFRRPPVLKDFHFEGLFTDVT